MCEAYHKLPYEVELCTLDQLDIITLSEEELKRFDVIVASPDELRQAGVLPKLKPGEARSHVQRLRAQKQAQHQQQRRQTKRDRRRQAKREMEEARARGEA